MEIKINLLKEFDAYTLFLVLNNEINKLKQDNYKHQDLLLLLEGNENNERAKSRLRHEKDCLENNEEKIKILENVRTQLAPLVAKVLGLKPNNKE